MNAPTLRTILATAEALMHEHRIDWKAAVRRTVGTTSWRNDPERVAAAEAKRASRMARNIRNQSEKAK